MLKKRSKRDREMGKRGDQDREREKSEERDREREDIRLYLFCIVLYIYFVSVVFEI